MAICTIRWIYSYLEYVALNYHKWKWQRKETALYLCSFSSFFLVSSSNFPSLLSISKCSWYQESMRLLFYFQIESPSFPTPLIISLLLNSMILIRYFPCASVHCTFRLSLELVFPCSSLVCYPFGLLSFSGKLGFFILFFRENSIHHPL